MESVRVCVVPDPSYAPRFPTFQVFLSRCLAFSLSIISFVTCRSKEKENHVSIYNQQYLFHVELHCHGFTAHWCSPARRTRHGQRLAPNRAPSCQPDEHCHRHFPHLYDDLCNSASHHCQYQLCERSVGAPVWTTRLACIPHVQDLLSKLKRDDFQAVAFRSHSLLHSRIGEIALCRSNFSTL